MGCQWCSSGVVLLSALLASGGPHLHWFLSTVFSSFWMDVSSRLNPTIVISTAEHMHIAGQHRANHRPACKRLYLHACFGSNVNITRRAVRQARVLVACTSPSPCHTEPNFWPTYWGFRATGGRPTSAARCLFDATHSLVLSGSITAFLLQPARQVQFE